MTEKQQNYSFDIQESNKIINLTQKTYPSIPSTFDLVQNILAQSSPTTKRNKIINFQSPQISPKSPKKGRKSKDTQNKDLKHGHWNTQQNKKYHWFLELYYKHFVNRQMRRMDKIFKTMQCFIGTRQAQQCRSHHQKMQKKYLNFYLIISSLRNTHYGNEDVAPIIQDLRNNNIQIIDEIASMDQLRLQQQNNNSPITKRKSKNQSPITMPSMILEDNMIEQSFEKIEQEKNQIKSSEEMIQFNPSYFLEDSRHQNYDILDLGKIAHTEQIFPYFNLQ